MDSAYYSMLITAPNEQEFYFIFDSFINYYKKEIRIYEEAINSKKFIESHEDIPKYLYKYLDFDGGIQSLKNSTIQFSHPLSFREFEGSSLADRTEFWNDRFYYDRQTLTQYRHQLEIEFKEFKHIYSDPRNLLALLGIQFVNNTLERNKVLCLSTNPKNDYLWDNNVGGICIEYDSNLFKKKSNLFNRDNLKRSIIYNKVSYVDDIIRYPVRFDSYEWLANLVFIKKANPYQKEEEFRILYTEDFMTEYTKENRENFFNKTWDRLSDTKMTDLKNRRFVVEKKFISKVYFKDSIKNRFELITLLDDLKIPYENI